jgi:outer membrane protein
VKEMKNIIVLGWVLLACSTAVHAAERMTLKACYDLALQRSESIGIQKEYIEETKGLMLQALSTALPKVAFDYSQKWQDLHGSDTFGGSTPEGKFTLSQPLFTGFKEIAAIAGSKHVGRQRQQELDRAKELLFLDVADAFYLYLSFQADLGVQEDTRQVLADRIVELRKRKAIGMSRAGEVASAEAKLARTEADMELTKGELAMAGQLLEFLTGRTVTALDEEKLPDGAFDMDALTMKADARADVVAAKEALASYKNNITAARSNFLPSATLAGNSYTKRSDVNEGNDWDVTLNVSVPLFNGMGDFGQMRQARAQANEADLRLSQVRRKAVLEIKNAYTRMESAYKRHAALQTAVAGARKNLNLQSEDFKKNLVNNLDVLQAVEDLQIVRRQEVNSRMALGREYWALQVATGEIAGAREQKQ